MSASAEPLAGGVAERETEIAPRPSIDATLAAAVLLGALALLWSWWAWRAGAWFGVIFYPGAIALAVLLLLLLRFAPWPGPLRSSWGAALALGALLVLGAWTLLSAVWSPSPDEAFSDGARVLLYAASFLLGLWLCRLLAGRLTLSLLPLAVAGGVAALGTAITLITGDEITNYLESGGTLEFPIGYRNANAAFFLIAFWPAVSLAAAPRLDWRLRGAMLGCSVLCAEAAYLSQSRGSLLAILPAAFVWLLLSPWRLRALVWLALTVAAGAAALPWLTDVYTTFNAHPNEPVQPALVDAGWAMILTAGVAVLVALPAARFGPAPRRSPSISRPLIAPLATGISVVLVGASAVFVVTGTDPVDWIDQRAAELGRTRSPRLSEEASRFGVNATSQRPDLWRVAWEDTREEPLRGQGAGAFQYSYARERGIDLTARDAHSVEMELLGELGFPALAMLGAVAVGAAAGALRSRRLGPAAATLSTAALAAGTYWLVHSSVDWFWTYPALTAPVFGLLGSAAVPALSNARPGRPARARIAIGLATLVAIGGAGALYLSERYTNDAYGNWRSDLQRAYSDLDRAQTLNPFSDEPLLAEGAIAREAGDRERAVEAFGEAADRTPQEWATHYFLGQLLAPSDPVAAERELEIAAALNPREPVVDEALVEVRGQGAP
jgi:hypothetical protein